MEGLTAEDEVLARRRVGGEGEAAVDELALLVRVRFAVVEVDRALGAGAGEVDGDDEGDGIAPGQDGGASDEVTTGEDRTASLEDRQGVEGSRDLDVGPTGGGAEVEVVARVVVVRLEERLVRLIREPMEL